MPGFHRFFRPVAYGGAVYGLFMTPATAWAASYGSDTAPSGVALLFDGSLTGNLLFGLPYRGFTVIDAVLAAILLFLALKIVSIFVSGGRKGKGGVVGGPGLSGDGKDVVSGGRGTPGGGPAGATAPPAPPAPGPNPAPSGVFDKDAFLRGAKLLFSRLQASWDKRNVRDIETFATPAIVQEVRAQADIDPTPSVTQIILVNAELVSHERDGHEDVATVFFDVLLREDPNNPRTTQVKEIWHFVRPAGSLAAWKLDGIQTVS